MFEHLLWCLYLRKNNNTGQFGQSQYYMQSAMKIKEAKFPQLSGRRISDVSGCFIQPVAPLRKGTIITAVNNKRNDDNR